MKSFLAISALIGLACLCVGLAQAEQMRFKKSILIENFNKINDYLSDKVADNDAEANFEAAAEWQQKLRGKITIHRTSNKELINALSLFLSMRNVIKSKNCHPDILESMELIQLVAGKPSYANGNPPSRRIELIVHEVLSKYYEICHPESVSHFVDEVSPESQQLLMGIGKISTALDPVFFNAEQFVEFTRSHMGDDPARKEDAAEVKKALDEVVVKPCKELQSRMGDELFYKYIGSYFPHYDMKESDFDLAFKKRTATRNCRFVISQPEVVSKGIESFLRDEKNPTRVKEVRRSSKFAKMIAEKKWEEEGAINTPWRAHFFEHESP